LNGMVPSVGLSKWAQKHGSKRRGGTKEKRPAGGGVRN